MKSTTALPIAIRVQPGAGAAVLAAPPALAASAAAVVVTAAAATRVDRLSTDVGNPYKGSGFRCSSS